MSTLLTILAALAAASPLVVLALRGTRLDPSQRRSGRGPADHAVAARGGSRLGLGGSRPGLGSGLGPGLGGSRLHGSGLSLRAWLDASAVDDGDPRTADERRAARDLAAVRAFTAPAAPAGEPAGGRIANHGRSVQLSGSTSGTNPTLA